MQENGLGKSSNYVPEVNAGTNGSKKKKKEAKEILDADLKKAAEKKDAALAKEPNVIKQIGIGLTYRKDQLFLAEFYLFHSKVILLYQNFESPFPMEILRQKARIFFQEMHSLESKSLLRLLLVDRK